MSLTNEIRNKNVRRNRVFENVIEVLVYGTLDGVKNRRDSIFNDIKDLIVFAAMVGKKYNVKVPVDTRDSIGINLTTFSGSGSGKDSRNDQHNIIFMFGLLERKDMNYIRDEYIDEVIKIFEEYSNGGLSMIQSWLQTSIWDPLCLLDHITDELNKEKPSGLQIKTNPF